MIEKTIQLLFSLIIVHSLLILNDVIRFLFMYKVDFNLHYLNRGTLFCGELILIGFLVGAFLLHLVDILLIISKKLDKPALIVLEILWWQKIKPYYIELRDNLSATKKQISEGKILNYFQSSKINFFLNQRCVKYSFTPCLLFLFGLGFSIWVAVSSDQALSIVTISADHSYILTGVNQTLKNGDVVIGKFKARENNLGIISLKFDNHEQARDYKFSFSIKELDNNEWVEGGEYYGYQFNSKGVMFFGFPIFYQSKNKEFIFKLTINQAFLTENFSNSSYTDNHEEIEDTPLLRLNMKNKLQNYFDFDLRSMNYKDLYSFTLMKIKQLFLNPTILLISLLGFLPLFVFIYAQLYTSKKNIISINFLLDHLIMYVLIVFVYSELILMIENNFLESSILSGNFFFPKIVLICFSLFVLLIYSNKEDPK